MTDDDRELARALVSGPAVGVPQHADEETRTTFLDRRMAQREAYGQFIATSPIYWPGTGILVFNTGNPVPMEHVEKWLLEEAGVVQRIASPRLAAAGARFPANQGGQLPGDGGGEVAVEPQPTVTPPAPAGEEATKADEGGTNEKQPARKSAAKSEK
jgi:hypothetical protein